MSKRHHSTTPKVFICHSHRDRHTAVELQKVLEEWHAQTFLDQDRIDVVDNLPARVQEGVSWCDSLLLLWSASAASSPWVQLEWDMAYDQRKKIIPYVLDGTPLPAALENLVYVAADDQEHGNALLREAVFGRNFPPPPPLDPFPGLWRATVDVSGMVQASYNVEFRANGQVEGEGGITNMAIASPEELSGIMSMRVPFHGAWSYNKGAQLLTIEYSSAAIAGHQQNETIRIHTTGREEGTITGRDLGGRQWKLWRVDRSPSPPPRSKDERQHIRDNMQQIIDTSGRSSQAFVGLALYCLGVQESSDHNLGLPTKKARRFLTTEGSARLAAYKDFVSALEHGGWIH